MEKKELSENPEEVNGIPKDISVSEAFECILEEVGGFGRWQWRMVFIASFFGLFFGVSAVSAVFLAATPDHWCISPSNFTSYQTKMQSKSWSIFKEEDLSSLTKCTPKTIHGPDFENFTSHDKSKPNEACHEWIYDKSVFKTTIVTEWNLVCEKQWLKSTAQSTLMAGILIGGVVLSELSDIHGRKIISLISCIGYIITSISLAFSTDYVMFFVLRFACGCFISGVFLPNFVMFMETAGLKARGFLGVMFELTFSLGTSLLSIIAYFITSWRYLQMALSFPSLILILYFWLLPESPRFLFLNGRTEEALKILRNIAKVNRREVNNEKLKKLASVFVKEKESSNIFQKILLFFKNQAYLVRTPILRRRCLIMFYQWFTVAIVYYGIAFSAPNLSISVYWLTCMAGLFECVSLIVCSYTVKRFGRRLNLVVLQMMSGVICVVLIILPKSLSWLITAVATVGKFTIVGSFAIVFIYSAELVPTNVRNIAVGASSMYARIGAMFAPYIVDLLGEIHYSIPPLVFGIMTILASLIALLLPETGKRKLPETINEIEEMSR